MKNFFFLVADALSGLDDHGILLDDNEGFTGYSLHRSDSGFGTVERKYSGSSRHRHNLDIRFDDNLNVPGGFEGYREDSYPVEEHSLNISDLEASDSRSGISSPLDQRSLDSSIDLDFDEDLNIRRPKRRHRFTSGDDYIPTDRPKSQMKYRLNEGAHNSDEDFDFDRLHEQSKDLLHSGRFTPTYNTHNRAHDDEYTHDKEPLEPTSDNQNSSIDYLLQDKNREREQDVERDSLDEMDPMFGVSEGEDSVFQRSANSKGYSMAAESLFTQDDAAVEPGGQSLIEFEQLEAAVVGLDGDDLIGAYLQNLTERDEKDNDADSQNNYDNVRKSGDSLLFKDSEQEDDVERPEVTSREMSRSAAFDGDTLGEKVRNGNNQHGTLPFEEESLSLIENQQPPFVTSQMSFDTSEGSANNSKDSSGIKPSKIPFLRSRSPSMSRPGSAEPRSRSNSRPGSRADTPEGSRSRSRVKNKGRTLPKTPKRRNVSPKSDSRSRSRSSSVGSQLSENRSPSVGKSSGSTTRKSSRQTTSSQDERDIDEAALLLADDAEVASLTSTRESNKRFNKNNRPRPASAGSNVKPPVTRSKSEATINLNRPGSAKQAKGMSSSRSNTPKSFRVRSQSTTALIPAKQPLKASHNMAGSIVHEGEDGDHQQKLNEETLSQLQQDYTKLLKKYAEAENIIDSLRIGAKIPISIEVSGNGALGAGQPSPGGVNTPNAMRRASTVSNGENLIPAAQGKSLNTLLGKHLKPLGLFYLRNKRTIFRTGKFLGLRRLRLMIGQIIEKNKGTTL